MSYFQQWIDYPVRKSVETVDLNNTIDQMDLTDIYRTFHPTEPEYTFFSSVHETLSRRDHMLGHKTSLNIFKRLMSFQVSFPTTMEQNLK